MPDLSDNNAPKAGPNEDKLSFPDAIIPGSSQYFHKRVAKTQDVYFLGIVRVAVGVVVIRPYTGLWQHHR